MLIYPENVKGFCVNLGKLKDIYLERVKQIWEGIFPGQEISPTTNFFNLGANSLKATSMVLEVESKVGATVPIGQIYLYPVLRDFVKSLESLEENNRMPLFIPLQAQGEKKPIFAIAPAKGGVFHFSSLGGAFPSDQPFYVIEPRVSASGEHAYDSIRDLAECCLSVIRKKQPQGAYRLLGYSFGAMVSWEIAILLQEQGDTVDLLVLLDASIRNGYKFAGEGDSWYRHTVSKCRYIQKCLSIRRQYNHKVSLIQWIPLIWKKAKDSLMAKYPNSPSVNPGAREMDVAAQIRLREHYNPRSYGGTVHLFRAKKQLTLHREIDFDLGWSEYLGKTGKLEIISVPGDHFSLLKPPHNDVVRQEVLKLLDVADGKHEAIINSEIKVAGTFTSPAFSEPVLGETYIERFQQIAKRYPEQIAVRDGGWRLSYSQLNEHAIRIARYLSENTEIHSEPVIILMSNSWQFIAALHGILLAGKCYLPLDPDTPDGRIQDICELSGAQYCLALNPESMTAYTLGEIHYIDFFKAIRMTSDEGEFNAAKSGKDSPALMLFTSGSTGTPKGVLVSQQMLMHSSWRRVSALNLSPGDRYAVPYSSGFMGAVMAIHSPLLQGATLCIYNLRKRGIPDLVSWMRDERITILHMVTSMMRQYMQQWNGDPKLPYLRCLVPGGELLLKSDFETWKCITSEGVQLTGGLGSTECGTIAIQTFDKTFEYNGGPYPIGKPFSGLGVKIIREDGNKANAGERGEIVVESKYIFKGYVGDEKLNRGVVKYNENGCTIFRTGDYGFIDEEGILYNIGRRDSRVKVNGMLVELVEVESVIMKSSYIQDVVVLYRTVASSEENPRLVAFYIPRKPDEPLLEQKVISHIAQHLHRAMIPTKWVGLLEFPKTENGKTDRKSLMAYNLSTIK